MQLVNMEVDRLGRNERYSIGPFSPGLNAVCGPRGAGKTTLLAWLRQVAAESYGLDYNLGPWHNRSLPMVGSVEIRDRGRTFRAVQTPDGNTRHHAVASDRHYDTYGQPDAYSVQSWLSPTQREAFSGLAAAQGAADTEAELVGLARRLGLDVTDIEQTLRYRSESEVSALEQTRTRLLAQLRELEHLNASQEHLIARRSELESELARIRQLSGDAPGVDMRDRGRADTRWTNAQEDLQAIKREIAAIDSQIAQRQADLKLFETDNCIVEVSQSYREQLQQLDDRLNRWRKTLADIRSHRERIEASATDARLDEQVGDQLATSRSADPRGALRALEATLVASREQLEEVVGRIGAEVQAHHGDFEVVRQPDGETRLVAKDAIHSARPTTNALPEMLRAMQKDLFEVCQQLSRQQSAAAHEKLNTQSEQLRRCESEMKVSIERLIDERAALLNRIASEHNLSVEKLTVAFGQWSAQPDHPNLQQWLREEEASKGPRYTGASMTDRQRLLDEIEALRARRNQLELQGQNARRQLRDSEDYRLRAVAGDVDAGAPSAEQDILNQIHRITDDISRLAHRDKLTQELRDVENRLAAPTNRGPSEFSAAVNAHIKAIMGPVARRGADRTYRTPVHHSEYGYAPADSVVSEVEYETYEKLVPPSLVRLAQRLAIAEALFARGEAISLLIDETIDELVSPLRTRTIEHLATVAERGQQIVILTSDERVAQEVRACRGWVDYLRPHVAEAPPVVETPPVNQELSAYANEEEAEKWYRTRRTTTRRDYYLYRSDDIDRLPAATSRSAADLRSAGIETVGDLLDADTDWLADEVGTRESTITRWQSEADLLCCVRKLRPFDARLLVGAGVRSSNQLASIHPSKLLARIEDFLRTDSGRKILSSGSEYELSRITSWISAAKSQASEQAHRGSSRSTSRSSSSRSSTSSRSRSSSSRGRGERSSRERTSGERSGRSSRSRGEGSSSRETREYSVVHRNGSTSAQSSELKFYLELSSPVVDAPTIGPRMASRLEEHGVYTVQQLLNADADTLAEQLDHRRVDGEIVRQWQMQAELVCRIPNLRGHDAQMLVACEICAPEDLASMDPTVVLEQVLEFAQTSDGARVLRGGKEPDMDEVQDWIAWSTQSRSLSAA